MLKLDAGTISNIDIGLHSAIDFIFLFTAFIPMFVTVEESLGCL